MTKKRIAVVLIAFLLGINLVVAARIYSAANTKTDKDDPYRQMDLIARVMEIVRKNYVDGEKVSYQEMTYDALKGMIGSLDPHSQFMEPEAYQDMRDETEGKFGGLGIQIGLSKDGFLTVIAPIEDTPAARAGLMPGDRIIRISGKITDRMTLQDAVRQLRGEPGTKVTITVFRQKTKEPADRIKEHTITRAVIKVESVKEAKIIEDGIGYIRITQFNEPTPREFENALARLEKDGMNALILDLRNNPGGLLDAARSVASKFVPAGKLIVSTEGRNPSQNPPPFRSEGGKKRLTIPLVVLINNGSASGSEIVAGALQDLKRAVLVGETTFGKGSVQSILQLPDGSALRLTTAKYYTPSHKVIHEHGVSPDIVVPISEEEERKLLEARVRANLPPTDGEKPEPVADAQLDRALAVIKGVKLFAKQSKTAGHEIRAARQSDQVTSSVADERSGN